MFKLALAASLCLAACNSVSTGVAGSGVAASEQREVAAFTGISASGSFAVEVEVGPARGVRIEADDNVVPLITTEVSGDLLTISSRENFSTSRPITVRVTTPQLGKVEHAGSGSVVVKGITGPKFTAGLNGSGMLQLAGQTDTLVVNVNGSGALAAGQLQARSVTVALSGSGGAEVYATEKLTATVSGSGSVRHAGGARDVVSNISGSGSVAPM